VILKFKKDSYRLRLKYIFQNSVQKLHLRNVSPRNVQHTCNVGMFWVFSKHLIDDINVQIGMISSCSVFVDLNLEYNHSLFSGIFFIKIPFQHNCWFCKVCLQHFSESEANFVQAVQNVKNCEFYRYYQQFILQKIYLKREYK
jgi:hypothetical protein